VLQELKLAPNQLTLLRLIFVPLILACVIEGRWKIAIILFVAAGVSDSLDGVLARWLNQRSQLGQYLDPIADKLLLSTLFLLLSILHKIPWGVTALVFLRDVCIVLITTVLYAAANYRKFRPSVFSKINTVAQIAALFFVLLYQLEKADWVFWARRGFLWATLVFTLVSGIHYAVVTSRCVREWKANGDGTP
jgi:cardiolipin synthase